MQQQKHQAPTAARFSAFILPKPKDRISAAAASPTIIG
jgi:hypothetical protein